MSLELFCESLESQGSRIKITPHAMMSQYTTLRLGGPADLLAEPENMRELRVLVKEALVHDVKLTVIGYGSNLLVRDGGIRGLVIRLPRMRTIEVDHTTIVAQCGASLAAVSNAAAENGLAGLEFAAGIPGTVAGGVYMNAGAYGGEMAQVVTRVEGITRQGEAFSLSGDEMGFSYRHSALQGTGNIITQVTMSLHEGSAQEIRAKMAEYNRARGEKQPLNYPSAGSTFKRPSGHYAAALIDQCGLKGYSIGGAQVSEKHAGFCVNRGGTAGDFLKLMNHVQTVVREKTGYVLEPEVLILGEDE